LPTFINSLKVRAFEISPFGQGRAGWLKRYYVHFCTEMPCNSLELPFLLLFLQASCQENVQESQRRRGQVCGERQELTVTCLLVKQPLPTPVNHLCTSLPPLHQSIICTSQSPAPVNHLFLHQSISLYLHQSSISLWALGAILPGERSYTQAVKTAAHIEREAGATPVSSTVNLIHHRSKTRVWGINESKSRLGLNPAHDKGW